MYTTEYSESEFLVMGPGFLVKIRSGGYEASTPRSFVKVWKHWTELSWNLHPRSSNPNDDPAKPTIGIHCEDPDMHSSILAFDFDSFQPETEDRVMCYQNK